MRAYVFILMAITGTMLMSCHDTTEGYLKTDSARYVPELHAVARGQLPGSEGSDE